MVESREQKHMFVFLLFICHGLNPKYNLIIIYTFASFTTLLFLLSKNQTKPILKIQGNHPILCCPNHILNIPRMRKRLEASSSRTRCAPAFLSASWQVIITIQPSSTAVINLPTCSLFTNNVNPDKPWSLIR